MISEAETDASLAQTEDILAEQTRPSPLTKCRADEVLPQLLSSQRRPVHQDILTKRFLCAMATVLGKLIKSQSESINAEGTLAFLPLFRRSR